MKNLLFIVFVLFLSACSKNDTTIPAPVVTTPPVDDSTVLLKLYGVDTTKTTTYDTANYTFTYDAQKRITRVQQNIYDVAAGIYKMRYAFIYSYTGTDTLPSKVVEDQPLYGLTDDHFLKHDAQGRMIYDSSIVNYLTPPSSSSYLNKYIYQAATYTDSLYQITPGPGAFKADYKRVTDANGNITHHSLATATWFSVDAVYDNKINPLYKVSPQHEPYLSNSVYACFTSTYTNQKNNFLQLTRKDYDALGNVTQTRVSNYQYTYKTNGLPRTMRIFTTPANAANSYVYYFVYGK